MKQALGPILMGGILASGIFYFAGPRAAKKSHKIGLEVSEEGHGVMIQFSTCRSKTNQI